MAKRDTMIRNPKRGKSHYPRPWAEDTTPLTLCGLVAHDMTEIVPATQTAPEDRCKWCLNGWGDPT